jgi:hypothetical protein
MQASVIPRTPARPGQPSKETDSFLCTSLPGATGFTLTASRAITCNPSVDQPNSSRRRFSLHTEEKPPLMVIITIVLSVTSKTGYVRSVFIAANGVEDARIPNGSLERNIPPA